MFEGQYFHAQDRVELEEIYQTLDQLNPKKVESLSYRPEHELYFWPLGFMLLISLLFFGLSELLALIRAHRERPAAGEEIA